jgi:hypothetical protein
MSEPLWMTHDEVCHMTGRKRLTDLQVDGEQQLAQRLAGHADPRTTQGYYAAPETPVRLK